MFRAFTIQAGRYAELAVFLDFEIDFNKNVERMLHDLNGIFNSRRLI